MGLNCQDAVGLFEFLSGAVVGVTETIKARLKAVAFIEVVVKECSL